MECPICGTSNQDDALKCSRCDIDFSEPKPILNPWKIREGLLLLLTILVILAILIIHIFTDNEEQYRRYVPRVKGDQRTLTIALENYYLDHNAYPAWSLKKEENAFGDVADKASVLARMPTFRMQHGAQFATLTTPVSYISSYISDPFAPVKGVSFAYWSPTEGTGYILWSPGPDGIYDLTINNIVQAYTPAREVPNAFLIERTYDPSNGTGSRGDVYRYKQ